MTAQIYDFHTALRRHRPKPAPARTYGFGTLVSVAATFTLIGSVVTLAITRRPWSWR